jgi:hypothetical protein
MKQATKDAALAARPGSKLIYIKPQWGVVWQDGKVWKGQLISKVDYDNPTGIWWGPEDQAKTRKGLIAGLKETQ